ncbi:DUF3209 domain-containing protein [Natronococcus pandeyae]|uniref:DUF3209 domain-containing protein n=1 Tax=Natronococcus pandeyae TaxID=2055836 RepID=A0A8J8TPH5_9EURY|nr:DUF3209 family protein [Natronococcus pandeyae]TYL37761.1 DUF3209 domain-containing protein [Natronococcus pandeyae]
MSCHEIEALRLGLMNVLGAGDESTREHAEKELEGHLEGPIEGLVEAESLSGIERHLDAALVDLEEEVAAMDADDPEYDYTRGRLLEVRNAERAIQRLRVQGESVVDGLGESHDMLHETFPVEE